MSELVLLRRNRDFVLLQTGQLLSTFGSSMSGIALALTGSAAATGYVGAVEFAPLVLLSAAAGVAADHFDRRRLMIASDVAGAVALGAQAVVVLTHHARLWMILVVAFVDTSAAVVFRAGNSGAFKAVVPQAQLADAASVSMGRMSVVRLTGPPVGGALFPTRSSPTTFSGGRWRRRTRCVRRDGWRARRAEAGGGVVLMNSIHQFDLTRYVTGLSFVRALAEVATMYADVEMEDSAAAVLRLSNGAIVSLSAAAHSPGAMHEERIEIDGSAGRLDLPNPFDGDAGSLRLFLSRPWSDLPAGQRLEVETTGNDPYLELLRGFVGAVEQESELPATAEDGAAALETVLAIYESAATGAAVDIGARVGTD